MQVWKQQLELDMEQLQYSCLENPGDRGAWWAAVCGVAQSWTRLKLLSSSSEMDVELRQERMDFWCKDHGHSEAGRRAVNFGVPGPSGCL